jgi:hypothetical protein
MAWTNISNALVSVGALPFATTIQALRDNPIAIANGDAGAPELAVMPRDRGTATAAGGETSLALTNITPHYWLHVFASWTNSSAGSLPRTYQLQVSNNNGASWVNVGGSYAISPSSSIARQFIIQTNPKGSQSVYYGNVAADTTAAGVFESNIVTIAGPINAARLVITGGSGSGTINAGSTLQVYSFAKEYK